MKITIYELLGMFKDGKAPKKIKYNNKIWNYKEGIMEYTSDDSYFALSNFEFDELNDEVEIIEEEKKIPEKIKDKYCSQISKVELAQKYNEIIDYLKSKGDE